MTNYITYENYSLFHNAYLYIDTEDLFSYRIFAKRKLKVRVLKTGSFDGIPYKVIFCKVRRINSEEFLEALAELESKIILMGYSDYPNYYTDLFAQLGYPKNK